MRILKTQKGNVFPLFVLSTIILQSLLLLLVLVQGIWIWRLSRQPAPTLVQLLDGRAVQVKPEGHLDRTPDTLRRFVNDTLTSMFSWSGTLPPTSITETKKPQPDPGIPLTGQRGNQRVTSATWQASFALSETFRKEFLTKVSELTPPNVFNNGGSQAMLVIRRVGEPQALEPGKWKIPLVANLLVFNGDDRVGNAIAFNKEIYVMAIDPPNQPLADKASPLEQVIYRTRQSGLEIYAIRDLPRETL